MLKPKMTTLVKIHRKGQMTLPTKLRAAIGVAEVWLISPEARTVEILLLENGFLRRSQFLAEGLLQPKLFPNVSIDIATIWPD